MALVTALVVLGLLAGGLSLQLQERWPVLVFLVAFFGVVLFLGAVSAWQHLTEPKQANLGTFKTASIFHMSPDRRPYGRSGWVIARDLGMLALVMALAAFVIHSFSLGGDALRGYESEGHHYVRLHANATEVTADQWRLNRRLGIAVFGLLPVAVLAALVAAYKERHDRFHYRDMT
ncbi:MAG: hypothetical protein HZA91_02855 [Verrucomicrobia bacterium]|nr:hypothetical protein [Verrucomicrobiota bacterium]